MVKCIECICLLALGANLHLLVSAQEPELSIAPLCESLLPYSYDSGETLVATSTVVSYPDAPWIQLDLTRTHLASNARLVLRGESATQELDAAALTLASNGYSAIFEGSTVSVEVVHSSSLGRRLGPEAKAAKGAKEETSRDGDTGEAASRIVVSNVLVGVCDEVPRVEAICGRTDDRVPSTDKRQGRITLMGGSCTAWMVSRTVFVTAGHCGAAKNNSRISFTYHNRTIAVPPEDQYAVDVATFTTVYNSSISIDWAVGRFLPNAQTGIFAGEKQGWYNISTTAPSINSIVRVTGYGTDDGDRSLMQQTHTGKVTGVSSTSYQYSVDTMVSLRPFCRVW